MASRLYMTRIGLERMRVRVVIEMMNSGAKFSEALAYIDLVYPIEKGPPGQLRNVGPYVQ